MARSSAPAARRRPSRDRGARRRAHELVQALDTPGPQDRVQLARRVLKSGSRQATDDLFRWFAARQADTRWGLANPLAEILGALRVQAIKALRGPAGQGGAHHEAALSVLVHAIKPGDLPLLADLLEAAGPEADDLLFWAIGDAAEAYSTHLPRLIAALEARVQGATTAREASEAARALGRYAIPEAEEALWRLAASAAPWPRTHVLAALMQRAPARASEPAARLLAELQPLDPKEGLQGESHALFVLGDALQDAAEEDDNDGAGAADGDRFSALIEALAGAAAGQPAGQLPGQLRELVALLEDRPFLVYRGEHQFFHTLWPLTLAGDEEVAELAIRACKQTRSDQAIARLTTRLRQAEAAGDERRAGVLRRGLAAPPDEAEEGEEQESAPATPA